MIILPRRQHGQRTLGQCKHKTVVFQNIIVPYSTTILNPIQWISYSEYTLTEDFKSPQSQCTTSQSCGCSLLHHSWVDGTSLVTINGPECSLLGGEMTHVRLFDLAPILGQCAIYGSLLWLFYGFLLRISWVIIELLTPLTAVMLGILVAVYWCCDGVMKILEFLYFDIDTFGKTKVKVQLWFHTSSPFLRLSSGQKIYCEAQGKGRAKGRPRKVTKRSFID